MLRLVKFGIVGSSGVVVNQSVLILLAQYIDYRIASLIAIETAIISNFIFNYNWTWKDRETDKFNAFLKFNMTSFISAFLLNWMILVFLTEVVGIKYYWSNLAGILVAAGFNFLVSNFWVFKQK